MYRLPYQQDLVRILRFALCPDFAFWPTVPVLLETLAYVHSVRILLSMEANRPLGTVNTPIQA
jgi:hypothetical protein